jgi:hypothetical protein
MSSRGGQTKSRPPVRRRSGSGVRRRNRTACPVRWAARRRAPGIVNVADGASYQLGGDWLVDRTTTVLPMCNYINASGNYSLRSYSLSPEDKTERVTICRGNAAVAYAGPCPPK